jgi:hypothetical protein
MFCDITITLDTDGVDICLLHLLWFSHSTGGFHGRVGIHLYTFPDGMYPDFQYVVGVERMGLEKFVRHIQTTPWKSFFTVPELYTSLQNEHGKILIIQPNQPDRYVCLDLTNHNNAQSLEYKHWRTLLVEHLMERECQLGCIRQVEDCIKK